MKLTRIERWILSNQMRILEILDPNEAKYYATAGEALRSGYEIAYEWLTQSLNCEPHTMNEEECREVLDILNLFRALDASGASGKVTKDDGWTIRFEGFDANNDKQWGFCRYLIESEGKFQELSVKGKNPNSHSVASLDRYRRQLAIYKRVGSPPKLTDEEIKEISAAAVHPEYRERQAKEKSKADA